MDLRALRYFIAVLEAGSLSRAAASLYVAQPALTAQIKKLESELGAQLFERSHVGVTPTSAGTALYHDARRLLSDAAALKERFQRPSAGLEGSVTLAIPSLLSSLLLGPVLKQLRQRHPLVRVFVLDDLSLMVKKTMLERRAEVGIMVDTPALEGTVCEPLARESIFLCGFDVDGIAAPLLKRRRATPKAGHRHRDEITFARAARLPLVLQSRRFSIRQAVEQAASEQGIELNVAYEHDSARVIRSLYQAGAGFTFTPACALEDSPRADPHWVCARVTQPQLLRSYTLATLANRPADPVVQALIDVLREEIARMAGDGRWDAELP
ncbi:LysR family transcriptional regulator [Variovorax sp. NFACC27]|uniref:LysR family transcriptional regulator n=1 Tax=unclassified Variovorax TaxID=663243 RepID=UPI00089BCC55|nr:DNA-binding transcriptional regulator, LysR family [Variovorax sp. NFACC28]SEG89830.1 DNA-binding transcriptional regulator, LysR family [Variovorax sp. NFACC29]SFD39362.1 DNA-binding transcriptional regulator, LysR family [Variovorax sp. NFACC26]SFG41823.1 DNA-binding transcriptional regulator, LysR family [Variovorax sp. NFACC27]